MYNFQAKIHKLKYTKYNRKTKYKQNMKWSTEYKIEVHEMLLKINAIYLADKKSN